MPPVIDLQEVDGWMGGAKEVLAHSPGMDGVHQAMTRLERVDALLASLLVDTSVPTDVAVRLGRVRDDLGGHVQAACDLDDVAISDEVVTSLLQRGLAAAQAEIRAISIDAHRPAWLPNHGVGSAGPG
jgi:hypothetical protein